MKSKAELPSTDVVVNGQGPLSGTTALNSPLSTKTRYEIRHSFLLKKPQTLCCEHKCKVIKTRTFKSLVYETYSGLINFGAK